MRRGAGRAIRGTWRLARWRAASRSAAMVAAAVVVRLLPRAVPLATADAPRAAPCRVAGRRRAGAAPARWPAPRDSRRSTARGSLQEAGRHVELRGHVVRRERRLARRARACACEATAYRSGAGRPWTPLEDSCRCVAGPALARRVDRRRGLGERQPRATAALGAASFGYAAYLRRAGVRTVLHADRVRPTGRGAAALPGMVDAVRRRAEARRRAPASPPRWRALARGMVLGADEDIPAAMTDDFKRSGLAHLLAVCGQNVTLLAVLAWPLLGGLGLGRRGAAARSAGPDRALRAADRRRARRSCAPGAMGMAGTRRGARRPPGLALVRAAARRRRHARARPARLAGRRLAAQLRGGGRASSRSRAPLAAALGGCPSRLPQGAALTVAATLATAPLMAFHFERLSLGGLPGEPAALPAIAPVMWIGDAERRRGAGRRSSPAELLNALNGFCLAYVAAVARLERRAAGRGRWRSGSIGRCDACGRLRGAGAAPSGRALAAARRGSPAGRRCSAHCALVAVRRCRAAAARRTLRRHPRRFTVTFLDVGQGDATLIQAPGGVAVLVDGGPPERGRRAQAARSRRRALDLVVLTHAQEDHQGGLEEVLERFRCDVCSTAASPPTGRDHRRIVRSPAHGRRASCAAARRTALRLGRALRLRRSGSRGRRSTPAQGRPESRAVVAHRLLSAARRVPAGRRRERGDRGARRCAASRC